MYNDNPYAITLKELTKEKRVFIHPPYKVILEIPCLNQEPEILFECNDDNFLDPIPDEIADVYITNILLLRETLFIVLDFDDYYNKLSWEDDEE